jgi:hypothetical protein
MIDPKFIEWMNMELDGVLPHRQGRELREYLDSHPEAQRCFEGLRATFEAMDKSPESEPPPHLFERIRAAIPFGRYQAVSPARGSAPRQGRWFIMPRLRYAAAFGFGIVFGLLVYSAISYDSGGGSGGVDNSDFWGTMKRIDSADGFTQSRVLGVDVDGVTGQVRLHESDDVLLAEVTLDSSDEIEWVMEYNADDVSFEGYRCFDGGTGDVVAAKSEMRVLQSGDTRYFLFFARKDHRVSPFVVKIYSADQLLLEEPLIPAVSQ